MTSSPEHARWRVLRRLAVRACHRGDYQAHARLAIEEGRAWRAMRPDERRAEHERLAGPSRYPDPTIPPGHAPGALRLFEED